MKRELLEYHIIHYYPNILSGEFINIGIFCGDNKSFKSLFLSNEHIEMINCNYLNQKKKILKELIQNIQYEVEYIENIGQIKNLSLYFNNFKFSEKKMIATRDNLDVVIKDLFSQYIGYKFIKEEKKDRRIIVKEKIISEIDLNFDKYFDYSYNDKYFDLVLTRKNNSKEAMFKTIIGSLFNEHDISRATTAYINAYSSNYKMLYSYFNSQNELLKSPKRAGKVLEFLENKIEMNPFNFNEENIPNTLEKILTN